ncbi:MAG: sulfurtransferase [Steroidobacteraceae bacterium]|jgi:thiosulfate/3-mercaptopyruvate sulfurtransferase|nr:sulfurtransferase [Steroidobacteraceae bacterium]
MTEARAATLPPLVDTAGLQRILGDPGLRIFDTTVHLTPRPGGGYAIEGGRAQYDAGHIPGAGFIDVGADLSDPQHALRFMLPPPELFAQRMSAWGVGPGTRVVLYNSGPTWWATRVWFMLREYGFDAAQVLDGGLDKWKLEGRPLDTAPCRYPPAQFVAGPPRGLFVGKDAVLAAVQRRDRHLVNALSPEVFSGRVVGYGRPGRIAGSVNVVAKDLLDPLTQAFLPPDALRERLAAAGLLDGRGVIAYCGGGISATTDAFALHLLGHEDVAIYDASMNEWGPDPSLPMERDA